jgi:hypothetical protein
MVSPFLAFVIGCCFGMFAMMVIVIHWADRKQRPMVKPPVETFPAKAGTFLRDMIHIQRTPQPERKPPTVASMPRSAGSWRRQKAAIERQHNSQQKERDRGIAGL